MRDSQLNLEKIRLAILILPCNGFSYNLLDEDTLQLAEPSKSKTHRDSFWGRAPTYNEDLSSYLEEDDDF